MHCANCTPQKKHSKLDKQRKQNEMLSLFALCSSFSWKFSQDKASAKQTKLTKSNPMGDLKSYANLDTESSK